MNHDPVSTSTSAPVSPRPHFIIRQTYASGRTWWVSAPTGYHRTRDGGIARDGSKSPEKTDNRSHAHRFKSRLSAARTASALHNPEIVEIP
jgi:hypothetical protein